METVGLGVGGVCWEDGTGAEAKSSIDPPLQWRKLESEHNFGWSVVSESSMMTM